MQPGGVDGLKLSQTSGPMRVAGSLFAIRPFRRALHTIKTPGLASAYLSSDMLFSLSSLVPKTRFRLPATHSAGRDLRENPCRHQGPRRARGA